MSSHRPGTHVLLWEGSRCWGLWTQQSRPCSVVLLRARCHRGPPALRPSRALLMSHCPWGPPICPLLTPTQCKATAGAVKTGHGAPGRGCRVQNPQAESRRVPQKGASRGGCRGLVGGSCPRLDGGTDGAAGASMQPRVSPGTSLLVRSIGQVGHIL